LNTRTALALGFMALTITSVCAGCTSMTLLSTSPPSSIQGHGPRLSARPLPTIKGERPSSERLKGRDWFYKIDLNEDGSEAPGFFRLTLKASDTGIIPPEELQSLKSGLTEEQYAQEFECSFEAAVIGAYYGKLMGQADADKRITGVPHEPTAMVFTAWDLGIRDSTAIWFAQVVGREIRLIDYYEATGADLGHYVREIMQRPYLYAGHFVPHDAQAKELGTGKSRLEVLESLGLKNLTIAPMHRVEDGINAVRTIIPRCWFDAKKCARGIDALKLYRAEFDDKLQALKPRPVHDWTSHAADAFRYLALTLDSQIRMPHEMFEPDEDWVV
jgi:phage terminase large subunit